MIDCPRMSRIANSVTGEVVFTPPEGESLIRDKLKNLEEFIHVGDDLDPLIKLALVHYQFEAIHPFSDGNGRAARLLEKWFLAECLNREVWKLPSEKYYKEHQERYYGTINLGVNFYELDYDRCLPFLEMLPQCLREET